MPFQTLNVGILQGSIIGPLSSYYLSDLITTLNLNPNAVLIPHFLTSAQTCSKVQETISKLPDSSPKYLTNISKLTFQKLDHWYSILIPPNVFLCGGFHIQLMVTPFFHLLIPKILETYVRLLSHIAYPSHQEIVSFYLQNISRINHFLLTWSKHLSSLT